MKGFINADVYVENTGVVNTCLGFENGRIAYIGNDKSKITEPLTLQNGQTVVAGFIDEHTHGACGADAMDGDVTALKKIANGLAGEGTTAFLVTTMTQSKQNIMKALSAVKDYIALNEQSGAEVIGVHLEGPFINAKHAGAQPLEYIVKPDKQLFDEYFAASGNSIKIVTLSPETEGMGDFIEYIVKKGSVASVGHTDGGFSDIERAIQHGATNVTHTYNAQKPLHHRDIGTVGSAYYFDQLNCECICDLVHVSKPAIQLLIKNKPHGKFTLITDAMRAKHMPDGISELGGQTVIVKNGEARLENGTLAGSILKMNDAIKNLVTRCGVSFTDAVDFATINPAKNLKIDSEIGSVALGKKANFAVLNKDFSVALTIRNGQVIFKA